MISPISIAGRKIGSDFPPYLIAELSANHNGSIDRALKSIQVAKESGADAVKLQTYTPDTMTIDSDRSEFQITSGLWSGFNLYDLYQWAHTPFEWHKELFDFASEIGLTIFSTPFDETAVDLLEELNAPAYKIASFEIVDLPLIEYIAKTKKPMIISTGMATPDEIQDAVSTAGKAGCDQIAILHCTSSYPAPSKDLNLLQIPKMIETYKKTIGFSDHSLGISGATAAVSLGARIVEKHFTINTEDGGPDSAFSSGPDELKQLSKALLEAWESLGKADSTRPDSEDQSRQHRRSIYFIKDLPAGHKITDQDIKRIRPGLGLAPKYLSKIIGSTLKNDVKRGTPTAWGLIN